MSSHLLRIVWTIYYKSLTWFKAFVLCPFVWPAPSSSKSGPSVWVSWNVHLAELSKSTMASKETYARFILTLRFMTFMVEEAFLCLFSQSRSKNTSIWVFKGKFGNWVGKDSTPQVSSIICNWSTISDWKGTIGCDIQPEVKILAPCKYKEGTLPRFSSRIGSSRTIATACSTTVRHDWPNSDNVTCHSVADFHVPGKTICFNPSLVGRTTGKIHWWANIQDNASSLQLMPVALFNGPSVLSHGHLNSAHQVNVIIEHSRPQIASPKKSVEKGPKEIGFVGRQFFESLHHLLFRPSCTCCRNCRRCQLRSKKLQVQIKLQSLMQPPSLLQNVRSPGIQFFGQRRIQPSGSCNCQVISSLVSHSPKSFKVIIYGIYGLNFLVCFNFHELAKNPISNIPSPWKEGQGVHNAWIQRGEKQTS